MPAGRHVAPHVLRSITITPRSAGLKIECTTTRAAAEVVSILLGAGLRLVGAFHLIGPNPPGTPVHVTLSATPPAHLVAQVRAIPDTTIVEENAT